MDSARHARIKDQLAGLVLGLLIGAACGRALCSADERTKHQESSAAFKQIEKAYIEMRLANTRTGAALQGCNGFLKWQLEQMRAIRKQFDDRKRQ